MNAPLIRAAGGVTCVTESSAPALFAVVHKRKYDEWCLPKGKLRSDETWEECALREVFEETHSRGTVMGGIASTSSYIVDGTPKIVVWFAIRAVGDVLPFQPNKEIDAIEWLGAKDVEMRLTHETERRV